ncbi:hypothetical protein GCM10028808_60650 [Spirosoma migulaei]
MHNPFDELQAQLNRIEGLMNMILLRNDAAPIRANDKQPPNELPVDIKRTAQILSISTSAIYKNIDLIPSHKHHGRLYFFETELLAYIKEKPERKVKSITIPRRTRQSKRLNT